MAEKKCIFVNDLKMSYCNVILQCQVLQDYNALISAMFRKTFPFSKNKKKYNLLVDK